MGFLLHGIELSDEQKTSIVKALTDAGLGPKEGNGRPDRAEMKAKIEAVMDAFLKDDFKAAEVLPQSPDGAGGLPKVVEALAVAVPLLTPEQRERLADRIVEGPMRRGPAGRSEHEPAQEE